MTYQEVSEKLTDAFKDVWMDDRHKYWIGDYELKTSTTSYISQFEPPKDWSLIAKAYAKKNNLTIEKVNANWHQKKVDGQNRGNDIHDFLEERIIAYLRNGNLEEFDEKHIHLQDNKEAKKGGLNFLNNLLKGGRFIPLKPELRMADKELDRGGTIDFPVWDTKKERIILIDWKTNKDLFKYDTINAFGQETLLPPYDYLLSNPFGKYNLQLYDYSFMLKRNTEFDVHDGIIVWLEPSEVRRALIHEGSYYKAYHVPIKKRKTIKTAHYKKHLKKWRL